MKKIVIIGCGFAGSAALRILSKVRKKAKIFVIDKALESSFLPMLPDTIGRQVNPDYLSYPLHDLVREHKAQLIPEEVKSIDLVHRRVVTSCSLLDYDYLLIASGSETNFYANSQIQQFSYKLDDVWDAKVLNSTLDQEPFDDYIISGGGYTGIEVAANLRLFLQQRGLDKRVLIVERAGDILGPLPVWMKDYVKDNLKRLDITVLANTTIESLDKERLTLSNGQSFNKALLIWAAGVKAADFIQNLIGVRRNPQGRIMVDKFLRLSDECFVAGDAAGFAAGQAVLRMAVQFAISQGETAARNIICSLKGKPLHVFKPHDLGYVIPMANNCSCGIVMGVHLYGMFATMLHYIMCIWRSYGWRNKVGIINELIKPGGVK